MTSIAILGPEGSDSYQAARHYSPNAHLICYASKHDLLAAFRKGGSDLALIPVYNTREGEIKDYFRTLVQLEGVSWIDNVVLPIHLSMGSINGASENEIEIIVGRGTVFNQCNDYLKANYPNVVLMTVHDIEKSSITLSKQLSHSYAIIESEQLLKRLGLTLLDRAVV